MLLTSWQNVGRNHLVLALVVGILVGPACPSQFKNQVYLEISICEICIRCFHSDRPNMLDCILLYRNGDREKDLSYFSLLLITDLHFCAFWVSALLWNCFFSLFPGIHHSHCCSQGQGTWIIHCSRQSLFPGSLWASSESCYTTSFCAAVKQKRYCMPSVYYLASHTK